MQLSLARLRADAVRRAFPTPTTLRRAITRMGFVQADPIRSPARAQDLILRQRVRGYFAGDLERLYPKLDIEEDYLYAYGFLTRSNWRLLHPRVMGDLAPFDQRVLDIVNRNGRLHPRDLEAELGRDRAVNPWGGYSKATTRTLHHLHFRGLLRIAGRESGIRVYEPVPDPHDILDSEERVRRLLLLVCKIQAPMRVPSNALLLLRYALRGLEYRRSILGDLVRSGELQSGVVDGATYVWPAGKLSAPTAPPIVRFLAPFDPLVWDRRRFEHFWGWPYRFEAYTPEAKRVRGYYAMPLLWRDDIPGWANVRFKGGQLHLKTGFHSKQPAEREFRQALDAEAERMRVFLQGYLDED